MVDARRLAVTHRMANNSIARPRLRELKWIWHSRKNGETIFQFIQTMSYYDPIIKTWQRTGFVNQCGDDATLGDSTLG